MSIRVHVVHDKGGEVEYRLCEALVGSPSFINSEVAVCHETDNSCYIIIGNDNDKNLNLIADVSNTDEVKITKEE